MTVSVTRADGAVDNYMRSGDAYVKSADGSLDIVRTGSKEPHSYAADQWSEVSGDERKSKRRFLPW
ncbi:hypothetical protein [Mycolicibacterium sp.]|uniref:hypothetical protein n=1 Tax=Mycolicibacterium sp. TaxID=2320850 RepID=UPI00356127DB